MNQGGKFAEWKRNTQQPSPLQLMDLVHQLAFSRLDERERVRARQKEQAAKAERKRGREEGGGLKRIARGGGGGGAPSAGTIVISSESEEEEAAPSSDSSSSDDDNQPLDRRRLSKGAAPSIPPPWDTVQNANATLGRSVRLWWGGDRRWYKGEITFVNPTKRTVCIAYTDGEEHWYKMWEERYEFLDEKERLPGNKLAIPLPKPAWDQPAAAKPSAGKPRRPEVKRGAAGGQPAAGQSPRVGARAAPSSTHRTALAGRGNQSPAASQGSHASQPKEKPVKPMAKEESKPVGAETGIPPHIRLSTLPKGSCSCAQNGRAAEPEPCDCVDCDNYTYYDRVRHHAEVRGVKTMTIFKLNDGVMCQPPDPENDPKPLIAVFGGARKHRSSGRLEVLTKWMCRADDSSSGLGLVWEKRAGLATPPASLVYRVGEVASSGWVQQWSVVESILAKCKVLQAPSSKLIALCSRALRESQQGFTRTFFYDSAIDYARDPEKPDEFAGFLAPAQLPGSKDPEGADETATVPRGPSRAPSASKRPDASTAIQIDDSDSDDGEAERQRKARRRHFGVVARRSELTMPTASLGRPNCCGGSGRGSPPALGPRRQRSSGSRPRRRRTTTTCRWRSGSARAASRRQSPTRLSGNLGGPFGLGGSARFDFWPGTLVRYRIKRRPPPPEQSGPAAGGVQVKEEEQNLEYEEVEAGDEIGQALCAGCGHTGGAVIVCDGGCQRVYHPDCAGIHGRDNMAMLWKMLQKDGKWECTQCRMGKATCFACGKDGYIGDQIEGGLIRCSVPGCGKAYHRGCIDASRLSEEAPPAPPEGIAPAARSGPGSTKLVCALHEYGGGRFVANDSAGRAEPAGAPLSLLAGAPCARSPRCLSPAGSGACCAAGCAPPPSATRPPAGPSRGVAQSSARVSSCAT
jgi:hypothetical protein